MSPSQWLNVNSSNSDPLILVDSVVYFWRVSLVDDDLIWKVRSFQHIINKRGWGQDVLGQFESNAFNILTLNSL